MTTFVLTFFYNVIREILCFLLGICSFLMDMTPSELDVNKEAEEEILRTYKHFMLGRTGDVKISEELVQNLTPWDFHTDV
jgi:hypothetical protein